MIFIAAAICLLLFIGSCASVLSIGKPRKPIAPGVALIAVLLNAAMIAGVIALYYD